MEIEERIISLETKVIHLEHYIGELNLVIVDQEKTIKKLSSDIDAIKNKIEQKKENLPENEKPPHY